MSLVKFKDRHGRELPVREPYATIASVLALPAIALLIVLGIVCILLALPAIVVALVGVDR